MPDLLDDVGREEWGRITSELQAAGVLARTDRSILMLYCDAFSRWLQARALLNRHGLTVPSANGTHKSNPAHAVARSAEETMLKALLELGCSPSARNRVRRGGAEPPADRLTEFLRNREEG
jgi:P27 family predicted phage terminase small subunit